MRSNAVDDVSAVMSDDPDCSVVGLKLFLSQVLSMQLLSGEVRPGVFVFVAICCEVSGQEVVVGSDTWPVRVDWLGWLVGPVGNKC